MAEDVGDLTFSAFVCFVWGVKPQACNWRPSGSAAVRRVQLRSMKDKGFDDAYPEGPSEVLIDEDANIILEPYDESILKVS